MKELGSPWKLLGYMTMMMGIHVVDYRYNLVECILQGYNDFHKGPEAFMQIDPVQKHAELATLNYKFISPEEAGIKEEFLPAVCQWNHLYVLLVVATIAGYQGSICDRYRAATYLQADVPVR